MKLTNPFNRFFNSEKAGGLVLICCTVVSLALTNSSLQHGYLGFWHLPLAGQTPEYWINDGLMTVFFLLIGLELEREVYQGELSNPKNALLPMVAALGCILMPAGIYLLFNAGTAAQAGAGIPMATDIAFALGVLSLLGKRVPASLKVFLTALAVIDDLGAIIIIAVFYTGTLVWTNLLIALLVFILLLVLNRLKVRNLFPYLAGGVLMWYFMLHSGVHATITGVLLAFTIPFGDGGGKSSSWILQHFLHKPVAFIILPLFAMANTALLIGSSWQENLAAHYSIGIMAGLVIGKPLGITLFSAAAAALGITALPEDLEWKHIIGAGFLGGIGFTMSIFITLLAFTDPDIINNAKFIILLSSLVSGIAGFIWLHLALKKTSPAAIQKRN
jgi:NhaA family Na+:H+ antiporter